MIMILTDHYKNILDFRQKCGAEPPAIYINEECVERVHTFKFLGTLTSDDLSWSANTTATVRKAQQKLHCLRILRQNKLEKSC